MSLSFTSIQPFARYLSLLRLHNPPDLKRSEHSVLSKNIRSSGVHATFRFDGASFSCASGRRSPQRRTNSRIRCASGRRQFITGISGLFTRSDNVVESHAQPRQRPREIRMDLCSNTLLEPGIHIRIDSCRRASLVFRQAGHRFAAVHSHIQRHDRATEVVGFCWRRASAPASRSLSSYRLRWARLHNV